MAKPSAPRPAAIRSTAARSPIALELRKKYFNRCNPDRPLDPTTDEEYVDVDELKPKARGLSAVDYVAERIELSDAPELALFTGLPGSGKSTELRRLAARHSDASRANLLPVIIDAGEVLDLYTTIDVPDVLLSIVYKTEVALLEAEGKKGKDPLKDTYRMNLDVTFLPMLKLVDREGNRCQDGFEAAREIVRRRVPDEHLREFLGVTSGDARVERLLSWSGGYPREIVRLLQLCVQQPSLNEERFEQLLAIAGDKLCRMVPESAYAWLAKVHVTKNPAAAKPEERIMIDELLQNNVVLRYHNRQPWFDVHPAVLTIPGVARAVEALREQGAKV